MFPGLYISKPTHLSTSGEQIRLNLLQEADDSQVESLQWAMPKPEHRRGKQKGKNWESGWKPKDEEQCQNSRPLVSVNNHHQLPEPTCLQTGNWSPNGKADTGNPA